jgi:tRNA dimethylallyltransferase
VAAREGRAALHARLAARAPAVAQRLHPNDQVRVIRALERLRGPEPQACWEDSSHDYALTYIGLTMAREALNARLTARAAAMADAGLADEVRALLARGYDVGLSALQGIGYREFARVVRGGLRAAEAVALMQRETVRYAKRQGTWFAREPGIEWIDVTKRDVEAVANEIKGRFH